MCAPACTTCSTQRVDRMKPLASAACAVRAPLAGAPRRVRPGGEAEAGRVRARQRGAAGACQEARAAAGAGGLLRAWRRVGQRREMVSVWTPPACRKYISPRQARTLTLSGGIVGSMGHWWAVECTACFSGNSVCGSAWLPRRMGHIACRARTSRVVRARRSTIPARATHQAALHPHPFILHLPPQPYRLL